MNKIAFAALFLILVIVNWSIAKKETHISKGEIVYLKLAPVDPRSLMQGDYMALRFALSRDVSTAMRQFNSDLEPSNGFVLAKLDEQRVATFKSIYSDQILNNNEILLQFRVRNGKVKFATNAFFFQEGHAQHYESAQFGQFRVNEDGEMLLVSMFDENMKKLGVNNNNGIDGTVNLSN